MKKFRLPAFHASAVPILAGLLGLNVCQAATVTFYGLGRAQRFEQTGDTSVAAHDDTFAFKAFALPVGPASDAMSMIMPPGAFFPQILSEEGDILAGEVTFSSQSLFESTFPNGEYSFSFVSMTGMEEAKISLSAPVYPNTPQLANFTAAQSIDISKEFELTWNAFQGATGDDFVQLTVFNKDEEVLFRTGSPGQANALNGSARSVAIPANRLTSSTSYGVLSFTKAGPRNTTALPGATGFATAASDTFFSMGTTGGGDPGGDPTIPTLLSSSPAILASNVPTNTPVVFTFSEPMQRMQEISWNAMQVELDEVDFIYNWSADGRTLTCTYPPGFPANTMIIWDLNPASFLDSDGNELVGQQLGGFFNTGKGGQSSTNNPCDPNGEDDGRGSVTLFKMYSYVQTSSAAPVLDSESPIMFFASVMSPDTNPVTQATLVLPSGATKAIEKLFGNMYSLDEKFSTKEALDAAYPAGSYRFQMQRVNGSATMTLNVLAAEPPVPQITNFGEVQSYDPVADFTLRWQPFTGATPNDAISLSIYDKMGTTFHAPDLCVPRPLEVTDVSILVPKNTFSGAGQFDGTLSFSKFTGMNTNSIPDIVGMSGVTKNTKFKLGKASNTQVALQNFGRMANGAFRFQVKAPAGSTLIVESSTDLANWTLVSTGAAPAGIFDVTDAEASSHERRYYRARTIF